MAINIEELPSLSDNKAAYLWIKSKGLLKHLVCESCKAPLKFMMYGTAPDYELFKCDQNKCEKLKHFINSLEGSFFKYDKRGISLPCQIHLIKYWCDKKTEDEVKKDLNVSATRFYEFKKECLEFITRYFQKYPIDELGGENAVVSVRVEQHDISYSPKKSWFLIMADHGKRPLIGFIKDLNSANLDEVLPCILPIIETVAKPGSSIDFDQWESLPQVCPRKFVICDSSDSQKDNLSSYLKSHAKTFGKIGRAQTTLETELRLNEGMWKERYQADAFNTFIDQLRIFYN